MATALSYTRICRHTYVYEHMLTHMHAYIIHTNTCIRTCIHAYIQTYTHTFNAREHVYAYLYNVRLYVCMYVCMHTCGAIYADFKILQIAYRILMISSHFEDTFKKMGQYTHKHTLTRNCCLIHQKQRESARTLAPLCPFLPPFHAPA